MEIFLKLQKNKLKKPLPSFLQEQGYLLQELGEEGKQEEVEEDDLQAPLLLQQEREHSFKGKRASMESLEMRNLGKAWPRGEEIMAWARQAP